MGLILRIDDVHPKMNLPRFIDFINTLKCYGMTAIIGVIPNCKDNKLFKQHNDENEFWRIIRELSSSGWPIAQHGYTHVYDKYAVTRLMGWCKSEFAGHSYEEQLVRLRSGKKILENLGIYTNIFMAPKHSYDKNTLSALNNSGFKYITDGYALTPYIEGGIVHIPQLIARYHQLPGSITTCCLHLDTMDEIDYIIKKQSLSKFDIINLDVDSVTHQLNRYLSVDKTLLFLLFRLRRALNMTKKKF